MFENKKSNEEEKVNNEEVDGEERRISVFLRVKQSDNSYHESCLNLYETNSIALHESYMDKSFRFAFDHIVTPDRGENEISMDEELFLTLNEGLFKDLHNGYNVSLITFGKCGSGKSHSLFGNQGYLKKKHNHDHDDDCECGEEEAEENDEIYDGSHIGICDRLSEDLFKYFDADETSKYELTVEATEVYLDKAFDLLDHLTVDSDDEQSPVKVEWISPTSPKKGVERGMRIREHPIGGPFVDNLTQLKVSSANELKEVIVHANKARKRRDTELNSVSNRGHMILKIKIHRTKETNGEDNERVGHRTTVLSIVDLAGIGRNFDKLKFTLHDKCMKEGNNHDWEDNTNFERRSINISLTALGVLVDDLNKRYNSKNKDTFIPFRRNLLTWLLKESLTGNSKTGFLFTVQPEVKHCEETLSTMNFAKRVKKLKTQIWPMEDSNPQIRILELRRRVYVLRRDLKQYQCEKSTKSIQTEKQKNINYFQDGKSTMTEISYDYIDRLEKKINEYSSTIKDLEGSLEKKIQEIQELHKILEKKQKEIDAMKNWLVKKSQEYTDQLDELKKQMEETMSLEREENQALRNELNMLREQLDRYEEELNALKKREKLKDEMIKEKDCTIEELKQKMENLEKGIKKRDAAIKTFVEGQKVMGEREKEKETKEKEENKNFENSKDNKGNEENVNLKEISVKELFDELSRREKETGEKITPEEKNRIEELREMLKEIRTDKHRMYTLLPGYTLLTTSKPKEALSLFEKELKKMENESKEEEEDHTKITKKIDYNYMCALLNNQLGDYENGIKHADNILEMIPNEEGVSLLKEKMYKKWTMGMKKNKTEPTIDDDENKNVVVIIENDENDEKNDKIKKKTENSEVQSDENENKKRVKYTLDSDESESDEDIDEDGIEKSQENEFDEQKQAEEESLNFLSDMLKREVDAFDNGFNNVFDKGTEENNEKKERPKYPPVQSWTGFNKGYMLLLKALQVSLNKVSDKIGSEVSDQELKQVISEKDDKIQELVSEVNEKDETIREKDALIKELQNKLQLLEK